jgi:hypothetical protein
MPPTYPRGTSDTDSVLADRILSTRASCSTTCVLAPRAGFDVEILYPDMLRLDHAMCEELNWATRPSARWLASLQGSLH